MDVPCFSNNAIYFEIYIYFIRVNTSWRHRIYVINLSPPTCTCWVIHLLMQQEDPQKSEPGFQLWHEHMNVFPLASPNNVSQRWANIESASTGLRRNQAVSMNKSCKNHNGWSVSSLIPEVIQGRNKKALKDSSLPQLTKKCTTPLTQRLNRIYLNILTRM